MISLPAAIHTNRFIFRPFEDHDAASLLEAAKETQHALHQWYGGALSKPDLNLEQVKTYIVDAAKERAEKTFILYGAFDKNTGALVGCGALHHMDWTTPKGRIGYWVRTSQSNKGIATKIAHVLTDLALNRLKLERLEIRAEPRNPASGAVAKKLGYTFLTVFEKNKRGPNGELWDLEIHVRHDCIGLPALEIVYA